MSRHPIDAAAETLGSQAALAARLGVTRAAVNQWKLAGREVPMEHCAAIEQATKGAVTCERLRPDLRWHRVADRRWPWHRKGKPLLDMTSSGLRVVERAGA